MFLFSKLVWVFGQPLSLAFLFVVLALVAGLVRWRATSLVSSAAAGLILFVTLYTTTGNYLLQGLEDRFAKPQDPADLQCIIVLGGAFDSAFTGGSGGITAGVS